MKTKSLVTAQPKRMTRECPCAARDKEESCYPTPLVLPLRQEHLRREQVSDKHGQVSQYLCPLRVRSKVHLQTAEPGTECVPATDQGLRFAAPPQPLRQTYNAQGHALPAATLAQDGEREVPPVQLPTPLNSALGYSAEWRCKTANNSSD